jgi:hypothetical protein
MDKKFLIAIIIALVGINIFTLINFQRYKKKNVTNASFLLHEQDELNALRVNFSTEIKNNNFQLKDISVKDSLNNRIPLRDLFKNGQSKILVCRFSELHCESCVNYSVKTLLHWVDSIGKDNVLFLGAYRNNKVFNKQKSLYGIDTLDAVNTTTINLPVEELGFPYYFVLDSTLRVFNVCVPDKGAPRINTKYLELIQKRYFKQKQ